VFAAAAAVIQDVGIVAAGFFQGIGQDGQLFESPPVVDVLSDVSDASRIPRQPGWGDNRHRVKRIGNDTTEQVGLRKSNPTCECGSVRGRARAGGEKEEGRPLDCCSCRPALAASETGRHRKRDDPDEKRPGDDGRMKEAGLGWISPGRLEGTARVSSTAARPKPEEKGTEQGRRKPAARCS
jgi:hypothetical protein